MSPPYFLRQCLADSGLRQISPTAVPSSPCRRMKAICASVNFDLFMVLPRPTARIAHAAKLEFSSKDRSENREAGLGDTILHAEQIENVGFQEVGEGLTGDDCDDHRQQHIARSTVAELRADRKLQSRQVHCSLEHVLVRDAIHVAGDEFVALRVCPK